MNELTNVPVRFAGGGAGGSKCPPQNAIYHINLFGPPTTGSFSLNWTIDGESDTISINYDDNATSAKSALTLHEKISNSDVEVRGGPFPYTTLEIEFVDNLRQQDLGVPVVSQNNLGGTTVVGVSVDMVQRGQA